MNQRISTCTSPAALPSTTNAIQTLSGKCKTRRRRRLHLAAARPQPRRSKIERLSQTQRDCCVFVMNKKGGVSHAVMSITTRFQLTFLVSDRSFASFSSPPRVPCPITTESHCHTLIVDESTTTDRQGRRRTNGPICGVTQGGVWCGRCGWHDDECTRCD